MMLKLKILTKRMKKNDPLEFYATREQFDNIKKPFSKGKLEFSGSKVGDNQYRCTIVKVK